MYDWYKDPWGFIWWKVCRTDRWQESIIDAMWCFVLLVLARLLDSSATWRQDDQDALGKPPTLQQWLNDPFVFVKGPTGIHVLVMGWSRVAEPQNHYPDNFREKRLKKHNFSMFEPNICQVQNPLGLIRNRFFLIKTVWNDTPLRCLQFRGSTMSHDPLCFFACDMVKLFPTNLGKISREHSVFSSCLTAY